MYLRLAINVAISIIVIRKTNLHDVPHVLEIVFRIVIRIVIRKAGKPTFIMFLMCSVEISPEENLRLAYAARVAW